MSDLLVSQEERVQYLRDRGVEIEFPEDREKTIKSTDIGITNNRVCVVKIPCDERKPLEELRIPLPSISATSDDFLVVLKAFFRSQCGSSDQAVVDEIRKSAPNYLGNSDVQVSDATLRDLVAQGNVESFPLARPCPANGFVGVNLYLDECGQMKRLPPNMRAAALAQLAGYERVPLVGDIFVGRFSLISDSSRMSEAGKNKYLYKDFRLTEVESSADWLKDVKTNNYEAAASIGRVSVIGGGEESSGASGENPDKGYRWRETPDGQCIDLTVSLQPGTSSKDIAVTFKARALIVRLKDKTGTTVLNIEKLAGAVDVDDCTWTYNSGAGAGAGAATLPEIEITLMKSDPGVRWGALESV
jgi:CS domain